VAWPEARATAMVHGDTPGQTVPVEPWRPGVVVAVRVLVRHHQPRHAVHDCRAGSGKQGCRIVDEATGLVAAEVKRKVTASGVALGEDVLSLVVEPGTDLSLVMGLVLVYGLM